MVKKASREATDSSRPERSAVFETATALGGFANHGAWSRGHEEDLNATRTSSSTVQPSEKRR
jgi:hypothetical protein